MAYDPLYEVGFSLWHGVSPYLHDEVPDDDPPLSADEIAALDASEVEYRARVARVNAAMPCYIRHINRLSAQPGNGQRMRAYGAVVERWRQRTWRELATQDARDCAERGDHWNEQVNLRIAESAARNDERNAAR